MTSSVPWKPPSSEGIDLIGSLTPQALTALMPFNLHSFVHFAWLHIEAFFLHTPFPSYEARSQSRLQLCCASCPVVKTVRAGCTTKGLNQPPLIAVTEIRPQMITYALQAFSKLLQVLSVLPQCVDVVEGVLGADLIGFHTYNYLCHRRTLHFLPLLNCNLPW